MSYLSVLGSISDMRAIKEDEPLFDYPTYVNYSTNNGKFQHININNAHCFEQ
jgi:hypothetical protein